MWIAKRYTALRVISILFKALSLTTLLVATYLSVTLNAGVPFPYVTLPALIAFCAGAISAFLLWARSETIMVAIHTEENTRETATLLRALLERQQADVPVGEDYTRARDGVWAEPPQRVIPPRQGPPPPRHWIDEQRTRD